MKHPLDLQVRGMVAGIPAGLGTRGSLIAASVWGTSVSSALPSAPLHERMLGNSHAQRVSHIYALSRAPLVLTD